MKKIIIAIISLFFLFSCSGNTNLDMKDVINPDADYVYFFGKTCSHCIKVAEYFNANDIMNKYKIEKREVWENEDNAKIFNEKIEDLGINPEEVGVPFVVRKNDNKYYMGDVDIIKLFEANVPLITN
ncbi:MAG: hypothetical protein PHS49_03210 [Candidatus Gracilibacteria bacterium]|nr:hypothetical protein [Candidatus Gracilibacteria bacterium]